ncbi:ABC transporter type 1, transmembrane domain-containing protein [Delphinella strobiligena]|nr:ABC transporter type 1, transmembrane domain-containing protein [Delphinella strobiligena]
MTGSCPVAADNSFGPIVHGCNYNDFTLLFEQSIFSIGPSALLLCIAPLRTFSLRQKPIKVLRSRGVFSKLTLLLLLAAVELALLIDWAEEAHVRTEASITAAVLSFVSALALVALSYAEHTRCVHPSAIINLYLFTSLLLDIPQVRTLFNRGAPESIAALFVSAMALKGFALLLEARNKRSYLLAPYNTYSPEALSSIINRSFQWWVNPLFMSGNRNLLSIDQLFPPDRELSSEKLSESFDRLWPHARNEGKNHPLRWLLLKQLKKQLVSTMLPRIALIAFKFCQPLLINKITSILSSDTHIADYNNFLIAAAALIYGGLAICTSLYKVQISRTKAMTRGTLVSAVFSKTINNSETGNQAPLTLMTNDTARFTTYVERLIDGMAGSLIEIIVALVLLERQIRWVCIVPIILSALASVWGFWNSGAAAPLQRAWITASQERISFTAKILAITKALKMLGLTEVFRDQIQEYRIKETELSKPMTRFGVLRNTIGHAPQLYAPPATLTVAVLVQGHGYLSVENAFTILSIVALLTSPVENLVQSIPMIGSAVALLDRIEEYLVKDDDIVTEPRLSLHNPEEGVELQEMPISDLTHEPIVNLINATFEHKSGEIVMKDVNARMDQYAFTVIYGPVGCGKSTFLRAIVGNIDPAKGSISRSRQRSSYCAQEAWLPDSSIQDIVTMETEPDSKWYITVMEACDLLPDVRRMPDGHDTKIGSNGVQLSGGQRQRLALARALYARNDVLVADDVLSGLDAVMSSRVFDQIFGPSGLCRKCNMTAVLATYDKRFAYRADHVIMFGPDGTIVSQGPYELVNEHLQAAVLDVSNTEMGNLTDDPAPKDRVKATVSDAEQDRKRKTGDLSLYAYYVKDIGLLHGLAFVIPACIFTFCLAFPSIWVKWWAQDASETTSKNGLYIGLYLTFALISTVLGGLAMIQFTSIIVPLSGRNLHRYLLDAVLKAPYTYFASTDTGVILNRFSQDMVMLDAQLAGAAFMAIMFVLQAIMEGALIVSGSVYLTAVIPAVLIVLYGIQYFYLRTSRQLRFLELEAQAPLQTHFLETIEGLATIHAFCWQEKARAKNRRLLDTSQRPFYLLLCAQAWLALVLDLVVTAVAILIVTIALNTKHGSDAASIGVSLIGILTFGGTLTNLIQAWTSIETSLGAVARVKDFETSMVSEDSGIVKPINPPQGWPAGRIDFNKMDATYDVTSEPVLFDFDLHIQPGEKVGICGRSGSGKSSVILALFRMLEISSGSVAIDGLDIKDVHSHTLRSHLTVVPQEPVLLPGSLRFNLDPFESASDDEITAVLERIGLWSIL